MATGWSGRARALVGRTLGEFLVVEPLSKGGFGLVFRAQQQGLEREAVLKVLRTRHLADDSIVQRFLREARLASLLDHPYAAHVYAFGAEPDGVLWIAMEMVRGIPLELLLRTQGPLPVERFMPLLDRICEVVHTAHEQGIVHRDLKPANVMVLSRAGRLLPKLLDFGIAKLHDDRTMLTDHDIATAADAAPGQIAADAAARSDVTGADRTLGSPLYMAPEQWVDLSAADNRTDIYALGVLAYEVLTGSPPFTGATLAAIAFAHATRPVPPLGGDLPAALDGVLARALAKRPEQRFASALDLASAFREASGVGAESAGLPRLDERGRVAALAFLPRPLAQAVAALEGARNLHQARDALWSLVRVATRWLAVVSLASHAHVRVDLAASDPAIRDVVRGLGGRALADAAWVDLARQLVRPFERMRDGHPIPELVSFLTGSASSVLDELIALETASEDRGGGSDDQIRALLEQGIGLCGRLIEALRFLASYPLCVQGEEGAEEWMGLGRNRSKRALTSRQLAPGRPVLVDADGAPLVSLWPFAQVHEPAPGVSPALFLCAGKGKRGARMVALPDLFEREDSDLWEAFGGLVHDLDRTTGGEKSEETCPYPGLAPFTEADAERFLGRERDSEAFLNRLRVTPLLVVVGPSGAGKTSFVQAGVLPGLPAGWRSIVVRPGPRPIDGLSARLASLGIDTGSLSEGLARSASALGHLVRPWAAERGVTLVLVVDQLEELYTLCDDPAERELYAEGLARAARSADDPVRVVLTLRDDFLIRAGEVPAFRSRLAHGLQLLATPAAGDLRRILVEPLRHAGYEFDDPGLPDEIVESVASRPGALPLLSFTASRLWDLRDRRFRQIGHKAYRSLGGVAGALSQHAEATLLAMTPDEQRLVREVFRHAVTSEGTRAVLSRAELDQLLGGGAQGHLVVEKLVDARLLVVSEGETGEERVEVIHEALLDTWARLVAWRRDDAEGARLRDQLRTAARQWDERGRPNGLLWRGDAADEYRLWRTRHAGGLTDVEQAFGAASLAEVARGRFLRRTFILVAFAALLAVGVVLFGQRQRLAGERSRALENEQAARRSARELERMLLEQYVSVGRRLVLADEPLQALAYLGKAAEKGPRSAALDFLIAQAVRATDVQLLELRHDNTVTRVRYSPDGARIATASYDRQARLWDASSGAVLARLGHADGVLRVEFSRDGALVATASLDRTAALWQASDGRRLHVLEHEAPVQAIQFSPDGATLVTVTTQEAVRLWRVDSGRLVAVLRPPGPAHPQPSGSIAAFSPDGGLLAIGEMAGAVELWSTRSHRQAGTLRGHTERVSWVSFSSDGRWLVSAGADGKAVLWDVAGRGRRHVVAHKGPINSAVFSADGAYLVTASSDRTAIVWTVATGAPRTTLHGHAGAVNRAVFNPRGDRTATASDDGSTILWESATGRRLARRPGLVGSLYDVVFDPTGKRVAASSTDGSVLVWSTEPAFRSTELRGHRNVIYRAAFSPTGAHVATSGGDGTARVWDGSTGREVIRLDGHPLGQLVVQVSPSGSQLATGDAAGVVRSWDLRTGEKLGEFRAHEGRVIDLSWHPGGDRMVTAGQDGTVALWRVAGGEEIRRAEAHAGYPLNGVAFAPGGATFVTTGEDNTYRQWDADSGRELFRHEDPDGQYALAFDRDGGRIAVATGRRSAVIRRVETGLVLAKLAGHPADVAAAAFSPDGAMVVTAGLDGTARIWEASSGNLLAVLQHSDRSLWSVAYSPDGQRILSAGDDGVAIIWQLPALDGTDLDRVIRCRVPYRVERDRLVDRAIDRHDCDPTEPGRSDHHVRHLPQGE